jgi:hypothetical protein
MPQRGVRQVEHWRAVSGARIHDLEDGLQVAIQVDDRAHVALERQWRVGFIPPSMWHATRQPHRLAGARIDPLAAHFHR